MHKRSRFCLCPFMLLPPLSPHVFHWPHLLFGLCEFPVSFKRLTMPAQVLYIFVLIAWKCSQAPNVPVVTQVPSIISSFSRQTKTSSFVPLLSLNLACRFQGKPCTQAQHMEMSGVIICFRVLSWYYHGDWCKMLNILTRLYVCSQLTCGYKPPRQPTSS